MKESFIIQKQKGGWRLYKGGNLSD